MKICDYFKSSAKMCFDKSLKTFNCLLLRIHISISNYVRPNSIELVTETDESLKKPS